MTPRELEVLHTIYRLGGQCSIRKMSKEVSLSSDYTFLISTGLLKQKLIKRIANNVCILTTSGRLYLEHFINPEAIPSGCYGAGKELMQGQLVKHNLSRGLTTQVADARSIQKSIRRLTFVNPVRKFTKDVNLRDDRVANKSRRK